MLINQNQEMLFDNFLKEITYFKSTWKAIMHRTFKYKLRVEKLSENTIHYKNNNFFFFVFLFSLLRWQTHSQFYHSFLVVLVYLFHLSGSVWFHRWRSSCRNPHTNQHAWPLIYLFVVHVRSLAEGDLPIAHYNLLNIEIGNTLFCAWRGTWTRVSGVRGKHLTTELLAMAIKLKLKLILN